MRTENAIKNILTGIIGKILSLILGVISRSLFLMFLSIEYLGASGLFGSILSLLSFAELGIGTAIIYSLYKPLAERNDTEVLALMNVYKKAYRMIGITILIIGTAATPFLHYFIKGDPGIEHLEIIYFLFVFNASVSYFFSYNQTLITADQKAYTLYRIDYAFKFINVLIPVGILFLFRNYLAYLATQILLTLANNIAVYLKVMKRYPFLKRTDNPKLDTIVKKNLFQNVFALILYKLAIVSLTATDNILISNFMGLVEVGIYANYYMIVTYVSGIIAQISSALTASVGNLAATENDDKKYFVFNIMHYSNFWIYGLCSICLFFLSNPFITLFFGKDYLFDNVTVLAIVLGFYTLGMQHTVSTFRDSQGLFWQGKLRPLAQAIINIIASIALYKLTHHISAIFFGTVISRMTTLFWFDPYIVHKYGFHKPIKKYMFKYIYYTLIVATASVFTFTINRFILVLIHNLALQLIILLCVCVVICCLLFALFTFKSCEFIYLVNIAKSYWKKLSYRISSAKK